MISIYGEPAETAGPYEIELGTPTPETSELDRKVTTSGQYYNDLVARWAGPGEQTYEVIFHYNSVAIPERNITYPF